MTEAAPLRILLSPPVREQLRPRMAKILGPRAHVFVDATPDAQPDIAFVSRDITGLSTKHTILPNTQVYYDALLAARDLRWVHAHSAGADRPIYVELLARGVTVTTSTGANAAIVAHSALAGILALARRFPQLMAAQREHRWASLIGTGLPRDLSGQTAVIVGWGPIGQQIGAVLALLGLHVAVVRSSAEAAGPGIDTVAFEDMSALLPRADWLVLACPLTDRTRGLLSAQAMALLPPTAHLVNVARGEVVDEPALIAALREGRMAGAFLDVFTHEPLVADSPLWDLPNVIATPHSAGLSDGNEARQAQMFLENLAAWHEGRPLLHVV
jgi:phosphoglycerate dehydrogenase-like enzyme